MNVFRLSTTSRNTLLAFTLAASLAGCKTGPSADDAGLTSAAQGKIQSDPNLGGQTILATAAGGVVTLNGAVSSDAARTIAAADVSQVAGVKSVVNNLVVANPGGGAPVTSASVATPPPAPMPVEKTKKPSAMLAPPQRPAPIERAAAPPAPMQPPPQQQAQNQAPTQPPPPPPPPQPVVHALTLAAGETIPVRITQTLDSASTQTGDKFTGAVASDIIVDGMVAIPQGTSITGHVDAVQDAAHFKGSSLLTISLTSINRKGERIEVAADSYTRQGEGRGKNTAEKVGGGAAVGAILGGIFGGGKGAAIGSAAGAGVGAGAQGVTRGQQVQIPSETIVRFRLTNAIIVHVTTGGESRGDGTMLEHRPQQ